MTDENHKSLSYKLWYEQNKESLAEKRRDRYSSDPEYKKRIKEANRAYRAKKSLERPEVERGGRHPLMMQIEIGGGLSTCWMFYVGTLAKMLERKPATIAQWEKDGMIPVTPYRKINSSKRDRLYTQEMMEVVRDVLTSKDGVVSAKDKGFYQAVSDGWTKLGVSL